MELRYCTFLMIAYRNNKNNYTAVLIICKTEFYLSKYIYKRASKMYTLDVM